MPDEHERFLRQAIALSERAVGKGNHAYGALLVRDGKVIVEAENRTQDDGDLTRHAELLLISEVSRRDGIEAFAGATLYASSEPCPMCAGAIALVPISTLVFGCRVKTWNEAFGLPDPGYSCREVLRMRADLTIVGPLLEQEALAVHKASVGR